MEKENLFKWKHYQPELILLTVRWYLRYNLSFRNLVEMMEERGLSITHTTIMRWVHQYGSQLEEKGFCCKVSEDTKRWGILWASFMKLLIIHVMRYTSKKRSLVEDFEILKNGRIDVSHVRDLAQ